MRLNIPHWWQSMRKIVMHYISIFLNWWPDLSRNTDFEIPSLTTNAYKIPLSVVSPYETRHGKKPIFDIFYLLCGAIFSSRSKNFLNIVLSEPVLMFLLVVDSMTNILPCPSQKNTVCIHSDHVTPHIIELYVYNWKGNRIMIICSYLSAFFETWEFVHLWLLLLLQMRVFNHFVGDNILAAPTIYYQVTYFPINGARVWKMLVLSQSLPLSCLAATSFYELPSFPRIAKKNYLFIFIINFSSYTGSSS